MYITDIKGGFGYLEVTAQMENGSMTYHRSFMSDDQRTDIKNWYDKNNISVIPNLALALNSASFESLKKRKDLFKIISGIDFDSLTQQDERELNHQTIENLVAEAYKERRDLDAKLTGQGIVQVQKIRLEIARVRIAYGWDIYESHGFPRGRNLPFYITEGPLDEIAAELFPDLHPESFDIGVEIRRDLENFEKILKGRYDPQMDFRHIHIRDFNIRTDEGDLNCAHLALTGILTKTPLSALRRRGHQGLVDGYTLRSLAKLFDIEESSFYRKFDSGKKLLFGKYRAVKVANDLENAVSKKTAEQMVKEVDTVLLRIEIAQHLTNVYGMSKHTSRQKIYTIQKHISGEDPFHDFVGDHHLVFGLRPFTAYHLDSVHALMNIVLRDKRLIDTHYKLAEAAVLLGLNPKEGDYLVRVKKLRARTTSILPKKEKKRPALVCDYDLQKYREEFDK